VKARELLKLGIRRGPTMKLAQKLIGRAANAGLGTRDLREQLRAVVADPGAHLHHAHFAELARELHHGPRSETFTEREQPAPWRQWGHDLDAEAVAQLDNACRLPVACSGALMPDAHVGYGLPIGGVLATDNAVIPYAVGVDIACRMKLSVLDLPVHALKGEHDRLVRVLEAETRFGLGARFRDPHEHPVMEEDWSVSPVTQRLKHKAWQQLGTSGSGNHFVEYGRLVLEQPDLGLEAGEYVALLSHSGSRGAGNEVARHYSQLAMKEHRELPRELRHLAWLELDRDVGREYWLAMQLMGRYAAANHFLIHRNIVRGLRAKVLTEVENHHNFAWLEEHGGRQVVVHRKGATPAAVGVLGVIPGSMATPAYVVRGKGSQASLESASHGAGRVMSRKQAKRSFTWSGVRRQLAAAGITVLSAGADEAPGVYKDIEQVMKAQQDLVQSVARFEPKIVKMAPAGERPED
jgi:tRNA-splicing ligase RtcB